MKMRAWKTKKEDLTEKIGEGRRWRAEKMWRWGIRAGGMMLRLIVTRYPVNLKHYCQRHLLTPGAEMVGVPSADEHAE
jgi:hypothetical protein